MKEIAKKVDRTFYDFLLQIIESLTCFLITAFEHSKVKQSKNIEYSDNEEFNEQFDSEYGEVVIGEYSYQPSEILFMLDMTAYNTELNLWKNDND